MLIFPSFFLFHCRYIAVTKPIQYAKHKNSRRVTLTILLVWAISAAIGSPIVLGLNNTPDRQPDMCLFYNSDFIVYSSLSSFYIPCIIMVFLYWNIFKVSKQPLLRRWLDENNENEAHILFLVRLVSVFLLLPSLFFVPSSCQINSTISPYFHLSFCCRILF
jgi:hypothetical protein